MPFERDVAVQSDELSRLPRTFGRYTLFDFVGKGGMAELFLARVTNDLGTARLFVVKEILPEFSEIARFAEVLIHEAKVAARLTHANIVTVFDLGRENGRLFITMEYVEGFDIGALLRRCTKRKIPLPLDLALTIVCGTLRGLDYAHRRTDDDGRPLGIVHRDVSPSNVLVSFGGDVKVCDFGIAHANDAVIASTRSLDQAAIKAKTRLCLEAVAGVRLVVETEHASGEIDLAALALEPATLEAGGLDRKVTVTRLPDALQDCALAATVRIALKETGDTPLWARVATEDGHLAWSSPIYVLRDGPEG